MTMRRYEVVYVLAPTLIQEEVEQYAETYSQAAREQGAEIINVEHWEKRKLAFRVKKYWEGYYTILTIEEQAADAVTELERRFKVNDAVIRFLTVRIDEELKRAAKFGEVELSEENLDEEEPVRARPKKTVDTEKDNAEKAETVEPEKEKAEKKPVKKAKAQEKEPVPAAADDNPAEADSVEEADEEPVEKPEEE